MKVRSPFERNPFLRNLSVSIAGARTGGALVADQALNKLLPGRKKNKLLESEAKRFVAELGRLKGTYVKIGQMMALMGEHVLPEELTEALHQLESKVEPLPWDKLQPVVAERLGEQYEQLSIDPKPLAAASLAQVHRGTIISTGERVCLKVLYPGVESTIEQDFAVVSRMLKLSGWLKVVRDLDSWLENLRKQLLDEVDYLREADIAERLGDLVSNSSAYRVPKIYRELSCHNILVMEYVESHTVTQEYITTLSQQRRNTLGKNMLDLFFLELFEWQLMQADPNFGNYRIVSTETTDTLLLLDFGSVVELSDEFCAGLGSTITAGQEGDADGVFKGLVDLGCLQSDCSNNARETFVRFCMQLLEPLLDAEKLPAELLNEQGEYRWGASRLMQRTGKMAAKFSLSGDFAMPSQAFAFVARKLTGVFTFISTLESEFNGADVLAPYVEKA